MLFLPWPTLLSIHKWQHTCGNCLSKTHDPFYEWVYVWASSKRLQEASTWCIIITRRIGWKRRLNHNLVNCNVQQISGGWKIISHTSSWLSNYSELADHPLNEWDVWASSNRVHGGFYLMHHHRKKDLKSAQTRRRIGRKRRPIFTIW